MVARVRQKGGPCGRLFFGQQFRFCFVQQRTIMRLHGKLLLLTYGVVCWSSPDRNVGERAGGARVRPGSGSPQEEGGAVGRVATEDRASPAGTRRIFRGDSQDRKSVV